MVAIRFIILTCVVLLMSLIRKNEDIIHISQIPTILSSNHNDIVLVGEIHSIKSLSQVYELINIYLDNRNIDTIFYENPYSNYVWYIVTKSQFSVYDRYRTLNDNKNLIYNVDVEVDLPTFMRAIQLVLKANNLKNTPIYLESKLIIKDYYKFSEGNEFQGKLGLLKFINDLEINIIPNLSLFKNELMILLSRIKDSVNLNLIDSPPVLKERDSLMNKYVVEYVQQHNVKRWAGFFGSYHIAKKSDGIINDSINLEINFYNQLLKSNLELNSYMITRINLGLCDEIYTSNVVAKYENTCNEINKNQCIYFYHKDVNWFIFKK